MKKTYLLGIINNRIYTGEFEITTRNGYEEFTACFNEGEAFDINAINEDYKSDYYNMLWESFDADYKIELLHDGDYTKDDIFEEWSNAEEYRDIVDCSCTDYELEIPNEDGAITKTINFETAGCGQLDIRERGDFNNMIFTNKKAFDKLMKLWDEYHLKEIDAEAKKEVAEVEQLLQKYEEHNGEAFDDFIIKNIEV